MDRNTEKRVLQRVYGALAPALTPQQRRQLTQCLQRTQENRRYYESRTSDARYGEAFAALARECGEQCKMLRQMLG